MMSKTLARSLTVMLLLLGVAVAQSKLPPPIPNTPAGRTLQLWLDAFNSGDLSRLGEYVKTVDPTESVDRMLALRSGTGGFDLLSVTSSEPLHVRFQLKERASPTNALGNLYVEAGQPTKVKAFYRRPLLPGTIPENVVVDSAMKQRVLEGVTANLQTSYVDPELAQLMIAAIQSHAAKGDYNSISDGDVLAGRLTEDLQATGHDKHLHVVFNSYKTPLQSAPRPEDLARFHDHLEHENCGFERVEILPNNIAYVKFNEFADASFCGPTVVSTMAFIEHADAVIFDLRENGGGQPAMVTLICSFLFDHPTHLIDMYNRQDDSTVQYWTLSYLPGKRLSNQPLYVLTSARTFSGAEEFAFDLKNQKRATIVGEVTGGGAHPVSSHSIADYFSISVPSAKSLDPITKTNWEGTGVIPDVQVSADDALATAEKLARSELKKPSDQTK